MNEAVPSPSAAPAASNARRARQRGTRPGRERTVHPLLEQLAQLHPALFGARFRPLKLGSFQDLMERHAGLFDPAALKEALGQHTRSTRYLECLARGDQRHDLDGQPAGDLSPDHQFHATLELFKRRQARSREDLQPALRGRVRELFLASGLDRAGYASVAKVKPETLDTLLDDGSADQAADIARREALLRAFEASGVDEAQFAERYGLAPEAASAQLAQARDDRRVRAEREPA